MAIVFLIHLEYSGSIAANPVTDVGSLERDATMLKLLSRALKEDGNKTIVEGKNMAKGAVSTMMGAVDIIGKGKFSISIGTHLLGNPITAFLGKLLILKGEHSIEFGLFSLSKGVAEMAMAIKTENNGNSKLYDAQSILEVSNATLTAAKQHRTSSISIDGGFIKPDTFETLKAHINNDGKLSPEELKALLPHEAVVELNHFGRLEYALETATGNGDLSAKLPDIEKSNDVGFIVENQDRQSKYEDSILQLKSQIQDEIRNSDIDLSNLGINSKDLELSDQESEAPRSLAIETSIFTPQLNSLPEPSLDHLPNEANLHEKEKIKIVQQEQGDNFIEPNNIINLENLFQNPQNSDQNHVASYEALGTKESDWNQQQHVAEGNSLHTRTITSKISHHQPIVLENDAFPFLFIRMMHLYHINPIHLRTGLR